MNNIDDIKVSSKLNDVINNAVNEGYEKKNKKNRAMRKNIISAALAAAVCLGAVGSVFGDSVSAAINLAIFDVRSYLGINKDIEDYKTVINKSISNKGITIQLNEVILDKDELIVSTTVKSEEPLEVGGMIVDGTVYINGRRASSGAGGSSKLIDEYTEESVLAYDIDDELGDGELNIEIKYDQVLLFKDEKDITIKGPWKFAFKASGDSLKINSKSIELDDSFVLDNGQKITLTEYRSNDIGTKIYYSIENKDKHKVYDTCLKGYDDLGNEVLFGGRYERMEYGMMKSAYEIPEEAKTLTLTMYAVPYPEESGPMSHDYKQVGEEFTINLK